MPNYNQNLQSNNVDLQSILNTINNLPEAGGVELPTLSNEGTSSELFFGKQLIDGDGNVVTGSFTIDAELNTQDDLITQIQSVVNSLPEAGSVEPTLQDKTVSPSTSKQTVTADSGYDGLGTVTVNAMPTATQATPSITVSSSGLITASATQSAGYVSSGTKSATKQLTVQAAQTITPSTTDKTISSGRYLTGTQTIKGDSNLVAGNIKSGVSIFGVNGSYEGSGGGSGESNKEPCTVTIYDNFNFEFCCVYLSREDNKHKIFSVVHQTTYTLDVYKNDSIIFLPATYCNYSSIDDMNCYIDTNMDYNESTDNNGYLTIEFLLTEDSNTVEFLDNIYDCIL